MDQIKSNEEILKLREEILEKGPKYVEWVKKWIHQYEEGLQELSHIHTYELMLSVCGYMMNSIPDGATWHTKDFGSKELHEIMFLCVKEAERFENNERILNS